MSRTPSTRWTRFWLTPGDPTTLAFMRIMTGVLALYVHLCYCFDLRTFFGPNAFWDLPAVNAEREGFPFAAPHWDWQELTGNIRPPEAPHRRIAVMSFLRSLPDDPRDREFQLQYLYKIVPNANPIGVVQAMSFIERLPRDPVERGKRLDLIIDLKPNAQNPSPEIPPFLQELPMEPPEVRQFARLAVVRFWSLLPKDIDERRYILDYIQEMTPDSRDRFLKFITNMPSDTAERMKILDYVDLWMVDPSQLHAKGKPVWSLYFHITSPAGMWAVHIGVLIVLFLFTIGLWTRVTSVLAWMGIMCYIHRTELVLFGMDTMMNILMIYLMIGPSGHALSVDRLIERKRLWKYHLSKGGPMDPAIRERLANPQKTVLANFIQRMIQIHFCFIYASSGLAKLKGDSWWNNNAMWLTLCNPEFCPFPIPGYETLLYEIASHRPLYSIIVTGGVAFTLLVEIGLPFLVWTRMRPYIVIGGVLLHTGIAFVMGLTLFSLLMMLLLLSYLPPNVFREQFRLAKNLPKLKLRYSKSDPDQVVVAARLGAMDGGSQIEFDGTGDTMELTLPNNEKVTGGAIASAASRNLAWMQSLGWMLIPFKWLFRPRG